jgi:hypothetical protein
LTGAGIAVVSTKYILTPGVIDQVYETRKILIQAIASQWAGHFMSPKTWSDSWIMIGLTNYMTRLALGKLHGQNEYRYELRQDIEKTALMDVFQPPLYPADIPNSMKMLKVFVSKISLDPTKEKPLIIDPLLLQHFNPSDQVDAIRAQFLGLKSSLVFHMLNRRLGKGNLQKTVTKLMMTILSGDMGDGLSTSHFLKVARKLTMRTELKQFANEWIFGCGIPMFDFKYSFNKKKMAIEIDFEQKNVSKFNQRVTSLFTVSCAHYL